MYSQVGQWFLQLTWREIRNGILAILTMLLALGLAVGSSLAAQEGNAMAAGALAAASLLLAAILSLTVVPALFRGVRREWARRAFSVTREGWTYVLILVVLGLAAFNTGNNLLFVILAAALAALVVSGTLSLLNLRGLHLGLDFPEVICAGQIHQTALTLENKKSWLPSFSLRVEGTFALPLASRSRLTVPLECLSASFWFIRAASRSQQAVPVSFPRRGRYEQERLEIASRFPFGFVTRRKRADSFRDLVVLPELEPPNEFYEILPLLSGSFESYQRGLGADLYSIRDYSEGEEARFLDWKATAKTGRLKLREFARQEDRKCCFVFDNAWPDFHGGWRPAFEKAVSLCANAVRHFHEMGSEVCLVTREEKTSFSRAGAGVLQILRLLALVEPSNGGVTALSSMAADAAFKIIFTPMPRGSIPTSVWTSSHVVFLQELHTGQTAETSGRQKPPL